ncbi:hypothetical protein [Thermogymnomonas acidicola]|uniref:hypothetical protein n=1 Tax=Thermogymnomonas acidicola TaxID=399579 RepID=UPI001494B240|nr:hypothetical protein [Thermogymnomonas acidicola]
MVEQILASRGIGASEAEIREVLARVKDESARRGGVCLKVDDVVRIAGDVIGKGH